MISRLVIPDPTPLIPDPTYLVTTPCSSAGTKTVTKLVDHYFWTFKKETRIAKKCPLYSTMANETWTKFCIREESLSEGPVAQRIKHLTTNQGIPGSSPCGVVFL